MQQLPRNTLYIQTVLFLLKTDLQSSPMILFALTDSVIPFLQERKYYGVQEINKTYMLIKKKRVS